MTITISEDFFSSTSSASRILVQAFYKANSDAAVRKTVRHFNQFSTGLVEIANLNDPVRGEVLMLWHNAFLESAREKIKPLYDLHEIPFSEYENILVHRVRRAREHGSILQRMRM